MFIFQLDWPADSYASLGGEAVTRIRVHQTGTDESTRGKDSPVP